MLPQTVLALGDYLGIGQCISTHRRPDERTQHKMLLCHCRTVPAVPYVRLECLWHGGATKLSDIKSDPVYLLCRAGFTHTVTHKYTRTNENVQECRNPHHKHTTIGSFVTAEVSPCSPHFADWGDTLRGGMQTRATSPSESHLTSHFVR